MSRTCRRALRGLRSWVGRRIGTLATRRPSALSNANEMFESISLRSAPKAKQAQDKQYNGGQSHVTYSESDGLRSSWTEEKIRHPDGHTFRVGAGTKTTSSPVNRLCAN